MKKTFLLTTLLTSIAILPSVLAESYGQTDILTYLFKNVFGFSTYGTTITFFIFEFILPLIAIIVVLAAFMKELKIFNRSNNYQWVLAIVIGLMTIPTQGLAAFVYWTSLIMGIWAWLLFVIMFMGGGVFLTAIRYRGWHGQYTGATAMVHSIQDLERELKQIRRDQDDVRENFKNQNKVSQDDINRFDHQMEELDKRRAAILDKIRTLRERE